MDRIVLAYSGDLDTTIAIPWLRDKYHAEIIAVTVDLGQGGELEDVRNRALAAGAVRAHVLDVREEFASRYVLRALEADAMGDQPVALTRSLGRALIVGKLMEVAGIEQSPAIAHGCTAGSERFDSDRPRAQCLRPIHRAEPRPRHDEVRGSRERARSRDSGARGGRGPVPHRRQSLGPIDRGRRARRSVDRGARRRVHAHEGGRALPGCRGVRRDRLRARRALRRQRRRDAAARLDREPDDNRRRARRRPRR